MTECDEMFRELDEFVTLGFLNKEQVEILNARRKRVSWSRIEDEFDLSGPTALTHCLVRTARARPWLSGMEGGGDSYLSPADEDLFKDHISSACDEINCVTSHVAMALAYNLAKRRASRARKILIEANSEKLLPHVPEPGPPSRPWLNSVCASIDVRICRGQELELARRLYCDRDVVTEWFLRFSTMFARSPQLLFNMDETYITAKKTLHVLAPQTLQPLVTAMPVVPHMTGAVTISATGQRIRPLIILPKKKTLRSLENFTDSAYFASSTSGWMTKNIFRFFAMIFVSEISFLRLRWPRELRDEPVLLFLDGHPSRWDYQANLLFWLFNIDVLTFPGHCTHLLQMFDISVASPLKTEFKKQMVASGFSKFLESLASSDLTVCKKSTTTETRSAMIDCFISACDKICSRANCRSAFAAAGVSPYCPERVLESQYAMEPPVDGVFPRRSGKANCRWLTSEESLQEMFTEENGRPITIDDLKADIGKICADLQTASLDRGMALSSPPELLINIDDNRLHRLIRISELHAGRS